MEKHSISVLGADKKQYEIADFRARGMNYTNAIGIIVTTEFMSRILAFDTWQERWGNTDRVLTEEQNESVAMQTFSGLDLTKRIVEGQAGIDGMTAAKRCWNYQKGGFQWYLPCLMELGVLCAYRDEINKAMKEIGCPDECLLPTEDSDETWVWSSSELRPRRFLPGPASACQCRALLQAPVRRVQVLRQRQCGAQCLHQLKSSARAFYRHAG